MQEVSAVCNGEEWRPVVGYEGIYEVSNRGRVRRLIQMAGHRAGKMMKQNQFRGGIHLYVGLSPIGGGRQNTHKKQRKIPVHVVVASAFLGPRPNGMHINHKDGFGFNNWAENLEYVTPSENVQHALRTGLTVHTLTAEQVLAIRALPPDISHSVAGRRFGVHPSQVSRIRRGLVWKCLL